MNFKPYYPQSEYIGTITDIVPNPFWCEGDPAEEENEKFMVIDNNGKTVEKMPVACCFGFDPKVGDKVEVGIDADGVEPGWFYRKIEVTPENEK